MFGGGFEEFGATRNQIEWINETSPMIRVFDS
jgi:hypothetical protein